MRRLFKLTKWTILGGIAVVLLGGLIFGTEVFSYVSSSGRMLRSAVRDSIPVEFEIRRARDLLAGVVPEMRENLRLVAHEEIEVAALEKEIAESEGAIATEKEKVLALRKSLESNQTAYVFCGREYSRNEVVGELERRFDAYRTAERLLESRRALLANRKHTLHLAMEQLEKTRLARVELEAQIDALEGEYSLVKAQGAGPALQIDETKLTQARTLLADLRTRLDVARRVMATEAKFVELIPVKTVEADSLVERIDAHFKDRAVAGF